jgi:hypothetical protein
MLNQQVRGELSRLFAVESREARYVGDHKEATRLSDIAIRANSPTIPWRPPPAPPPPPAPRPAPPCCPAGPR